MRILQESCSVTNAEGKLEGFLTSEMFPPFSDTALELNVKEIMGCDLNAIPNGPTVYETGRNVMAEYPSINVLPIVDKVNRPIILLGRRVILYR